MAVFELYDAAPPEPEGDLFGLWSTAPAATSARGPEEAVAFGPPTAKAPDQPVLPAGGGTLWRANYPGDPAQAAEHLRTARSRLRASQAALAHAPRRLDAFVSQRQAGLAYAFPTAGATPPRPEDELGLLLPQVQTTGPVVHYGPVDQITEVWRDAQQAFESFSERLRQMVAHFAYVETRVAGELVGRTRMSWAGDVDTALSGRIVPDQVRLHQHTLEMALVSRRTLLQTSATVIAGAIKLSVLLSSPAGFVAAFPAILRFVNRLRKELG